MNPISQWHKIKYRLCPIIIYHVQDISKDEVHSMDALDMYINIIYAHIIHYTFSIFIVKSLFIEQMIANDSKERETLE